MAIPASINRNTGRDPRGRLRICAPSTIRGRVAPRGRVPGISRSGRPWRSGGVRPAAAIWA